MTDEDRPGYRLDRLELYNWGTFDQRVWRYEQHGRNGLLTGDIGSGKSTVVDAITTLLLPAHRISYNKAAGAETRERDLRSYVLGHYKSERNEALGTSRPVGLRDRTSFSVILGVLANHGFDATVSLAQVFWFKDQAGAGQPDRFFVTADRALSIAGDFGDFGGDIAALKRRLRKAGATIRDAFPDYGKDFRRLLGIESEQAMELFHQTVSMKSVGNLNDFVRNHMLEPFAADAAIKGLVDHFEDLTRAHDAVVRARDQLALLDPLLTDCDEYGRRGAEIDAVRSRRDALPYYFADRKHGLLTVQIDAWREEADALGADLDSAKDKVERLRKEQRRLELKRAGHGGDRIAEIGREIDECARVRDERQYRAQRFAELLGDIGLRPAETAEQFGERLREVRRRAATLDDEKTVQQNILTEVAVRLRDADNDARDINTELRSLRERPSNIPARQLELRRRLCTELRIDEADLPYAGELIKVRDDERDWEGAAERLLHGFGLALLVSGEHYAAVSDWIDGHHLGGRLVYFRVPGATVDRLPEIGNRALYSKLEIKDSPFAEWLDRELRHRADYECVDTMAEFRRARTAITRAGQIKGGRGRHEKDDRHRIDDRRHYVLGWSNASKIETLLAEAERLTRVLAELNATQSTAKGALTELDRFAGTASKLVEFRGYSDIDWRAMVGRIADLDAERHRIESSSDALREIATQLEDVGKRLKIADGDVTRISTGLGAIDRDISVAETTSTDLGQLLTHPDYEVARMQFPELERAAKRHATDTVPACDHAQARLTAEFTTRAENLSKEQRAAGNRAITKMAGFRAKYPLETEELDDSLESADGYRQLHRRLADDDLPRFEADFKTYLNTNTIRDIAGFHAQLGNQVELIRERVETINKSLSGIPYNPGRYIRLELQPTSNVEIRDFRTQLRECTSGAVDDGGDQYSEQKFLQVKSIIERFRGREGQTEADKSWTRRVTDVRNWFVFSASERWLKDDTEHENYTDSGGKSGGQKEKLAYTILAASLAYQFKLDWDAVQSTTFRFVVIDEAFGRGSDESTRFALGLFRRLGLQLLIVTPLQKIHVIEPFVSSVGFVDNKTGAYSRMQTLTIEEYRQRQLAHVLASGDAVEGR
ncbi:MULTISPECIES: ATP-binding protein [unclassified Nocardia]|uniref:ATP-binding protein n=1 Tax=unclassified Nocardia TaxID=2637762 RepID=UPI00278C35DD|nr:MULTISPECIES: ATP-binding protein [unclassified Nocardia]